MPAVEVTGDVADQKGVVEFQDDRVDAEAKSRRVRLRQALLA
ncbi:MAG TPA: hypothetical protein VID71_05980 [Steroidobacteraceae bacterium]